MSDNNSGEKPQQRNRGQQNNNRRGNNNNNNQSNQQQNNVPQNSVLARTQTRRGEVQRAARRNSELVTQVASQHVIDVPVNKSVYNGYHGEQFTLLQQK